MKDYLIYAENARKVIIIYTIAIYVKEISAKNAKLISVDIDKETTHACVEDTTSEEKQCKQMKLCSAVENADMTDGIICSNDFYYDKEKYICQKNDESNLCEQIYLCDKAPSDDTGTCSDYATSDDHHVCIEGGTGSKYKEEFICSKFC